MKINVQTRKRLEKSFMIYTINIFKYKLVLKVCCDQEYE